MKSDPPPPSLVTPGGWLALTAVALLLLLAGLWTLLGNIPRMVDGRGVILRNSEAGLIRLQAIRHGVLTQVNVAEGDLITQGQIIAELQPSTDGGDGESIHALRSGRVIEVIASAGDVVEPGTGIARIESTFGPYEALLYVSALEGKRVKPGMEGRLLLAPAHPSHRSLKARVTYVSPYPITREYLSKELGGDEHLAGWLLDHNATTEVVLELIHDSENDSSTSKTESGQLLSGRVIIEHVHPISWLFASRRE